MQGNAVSWRLVKEWAGRLSEVKWEVLKVVCGVPSSREGFPKPKNHYDGEAAAGTTTVSMSSCGGAAR